MGRKSVMGVIVPVCLAVLFIAGAAFAGSAGTALPEEFSWYGRSGATNQPVYDGEKGGLWWMPDEIPSGKENTQWGNRGYIFVGAKKEKPAVTRVKCVFMKLKDVLFPFDSAKIDSANLKVLKENADMIKSNPRVNILLVGSASPEGESVYNQKLSERRVTAVKNYLINKAGIAADRLKTQADGEIQVPDKSSWPMLRKVSFVTVK